MKFPPPGQPLVLAPPSCAPRSGSAQGQEGISGGIFWEAAGLRSWQGATGAASLQESELSPSPAAPRRVPEPFTALPARFGWHRIAEKQFPSPSCSPQVLRLNLLVPSIFLAGRAAPAGTEICQKKPFPASSTGRAPLKCPSLT